MLTQIRRMRSRRPRFLATALVALLPAAPLSAQEVGTRPAPRSSVVFRTAVPSYEMKLREPVAPIIPAAPPVSVSIPTGLPAAPVPPVAKGAAKKSAPTASGQRRPTAPAFAQTLPEPRSVLPPRNTPPASALPIGGSELALQPTTFTPYDRYMGSVRTVIANLEPHPSTMTLAARLMKEGRRMRYCLSDPYRADPPSVTAGRKAGDCKSKALWLFDGLGDTNALFVIGKVQKRARSSHAWVYWRYDDRWWILDCTERADPIAADSVSSDRYVPYYSFGKAGTFRHRATSLILSGAITPSASPVAAKR